MISWIEYRQAETAKGYPMNEAKKGQHSWKNEFGFKAQKVLLTEEHQNAFRAIVKAKFADEAKTAFTPAKQKEIVLKCRTEYNELVKRHRNGESIF